MRTLAQSPHLTLDRPALVISLDSEQIWGYLDMLDDREFSQRYPNTPAAYEHLLRMLSSAGVSATWLVVGGLTLRGSRGPNDARMQRIPRDWTRFVPEGNEMTAPLWYRRAFVKQLANSNPKQEIGLHGGLTHLIWSDSRTSEQAARAELTAGLTAMEEIGIYPRSFSFPRNQERYHHLLADSGLQCYRGRAPILSEKLGRSLPGSLLRLVNELDRTAPPPVWPLELQPGLWNIPASLFLYPIGNRRSRWVPLRSRIERVKRGVDAAIRHNGVFHFCLHPVNLAESTQGFALFESILEEFVRAREKGDADILTMSQVATNMELATEKAGVRECRATATASAAPAMMPMQRTGTTKTPS